MVEDKQEGEVACTTALSFGKHCDKDGTEACNWNHSGNKHRHKEYCTLVSGLFHAEMHAVFCTSCLGAVTALCTIGIIQQASDSGLCIWLSNGMGMGAMCIQLYYGAKTLFLQGNILDELNALPLCIFSGFGPIWQS